MRRSIGLLTYTNVVGKQQVGIANAIQYDGLFIVATAAHCVFDWEARAFNTDISFRPMVTRAGSVFKAREIAVHRGWATQAIVDYDTAFIKLDISDDEAIATVSPSKVRFDLPRGLEYHVIGVHRRLTSWQLVQFYDGAESDVAARSTLQSVRAKPRRGMSGGPWFLNDGGQPIQNSVTSLTFGSSPSRLFGPYWGAEVERICSSLCTTSENADVVMWTRWSGHCEIGEKYIEGGES